MYLPAMGRHYKRNMKVGQRISCRGAVPDRESRRFSAPSDRQDAGATLVERGVPGKYNLKLLGSDASPRQSIGRPAEPMGRAAPPGVLPGTWRPAAPKSGTRHCGWPSAPASGRLPAAGRRPLRLPGTAAFPATNPSLEPDGGCSVAPGAKVCKIRGRPRSKQGQTGRTT